MPTELTQIGETLQRMSDLKEFDILSRWYSHLYEGQKHYSWNKIKIERLSELSAKLWGDSEPL